VLNLSETGVDKAHVGVADRLMYQAKNDGGTIWIRTPGDPRGGWLDDFGDDQRSPRAA
jgi:hypothetical protein